MYKKAAVIALGLVLAMGVVRAEWSYTLPVVNYGPGQDFAIPVYATTEDGIKAFQFQMHFCEDADSLKIVVDSVTLHGNADYVTLFDTLPTAAPWQANFNVTFARSMIFGGAVDFGQNGTNPLDNQVLVLIWGRVDAAVTAPDTIELDLDSIVPCPPNQHTDVIFTDNNGQTQVATLYDGAIIVPLYSMTLTATPPPPQSVNEGDHLTITIDGTSSDPADNLIIDVVSGLESFMNWTDGTPGYPVSGTLDLDPGYCDDGQYVVVFQLTSTVHGQSITFADTINVINLNQEPECVGVVPPGGRYATNANVHMDVTFSDPDLACQAPHTTDMLTLTMEITPAPVTSPTFVDNGDGTGDFDWTPTIDDVGTYSVSFIGTDLSGAADTCTVELEIVSCEVPSYADYNFQIKKMCAYAGEDIDYPVFLTFMDESVDPVAAYEVLIAWDPSCMTLTGVSEKKVQNYYSEYFDYDIIPAGVVDIWPAVRVVAIRDKANNVYTPPIYPPECQLELFDLHFHMNHDWDPNYACDVKFLVNECGDNTISDPTGINLHVPDYIFKVMVDDTIPDSCSVNSIYVGDVCPGPDTVMHDVALLDGFNWWDDPCVPNACVTGDIVSYPFNYTTGDVNLNTVPYEVADAAFFNHYLLGYYTVDDDPNTPPQDWTGQDWQLSMMASDINHNTVPWEMGDLVLMTAVINGFIAPLSYTVPSEPVKLTVSGDNIYIDAPTELGGVYLVIKYEGEIGEPVLGEYANGMTLDWNDLGGELRVIIWSLDHHTMPAGEGLLLTIPGLKAENITKIDVADFVGNTLSVEKGLASFALRKAVPNPFKGTTEIGFAVASEANVNVSVYDISGKLVRTLVNRKLVPGEYTAAWDGRDNRGHSVKSGVYFVKMTAGKFSASRKLMLLK
ncbi:MAG: T9SS type A sorting domain-containing protein [Candidatus Hydrothermae bacterium]|nr:T9SS type A sorting domain-containing protein [Candidatus Hydrothermae bacterium]